MIKSKEEILSELRSKVLDPNITESIDDLIKLYEVKVNLLESIIKEKDTLLKSSFSDFTKLEVFDKLSGKSHIVGTSVHDVLEVHAGKVSYYNLQNGGGTPYDYEFVEKSII